MDITIDTTYCDPPRVGRLPKVEKIYSHNQADRISDTSETASTSICGRSKWKPARRKQHQITQNIYVEYDKTLKRSLFIELKKRIRKVRNMRMTMQLSSTSVKTSSSVYQLRWFQVLKNYLSRCLIIWIIKKRLSLGVYYA